MDRILCWPMEEDLIGRLAGLLCEAGGRDFSSTAVVFGGRRPALFLRREIAGRLGHGYVPPRCFSMDEFMEYLVSRHRPVRMLSDLEACHLIYSLAGSVAPGILLGRERFARFLPWAREIFSFLEQVVLEDVSPDRMHWVEIQASAGFSVPESVNAFLANIADIRVAFWKHLQEQDVWTRGRLYAEASRLEAPASIREFEKVFFAGFFDLHATEKRVVRGIVESGTGHLIVQGGEEWPALKEIARELSCPLESHGPSGRVPAFSAWSVADKQAQACQVRDILKGLDSPEGTVVVLPDPSGLVPLLSEISPVVSKVNVSLGYPLRRSALFSLLQMIFQAQGGRRDRLYRSSDYLRVLRHPFIKNLALALPAAATRILIHKIEEALAGAIPCKVAGAVFLSLEDIADAEEIRTSAWEVLARTGTDCDPGALQEAMRRLHELLFRSWEGIRSLASLADTLDVFLPLLLEGTTIHRYPPNLAVLETLLSQVDSVRLSPAGREEFGQEDVFCIFTDMLSNAAVPFRGSPLSGLQVLGLLETRCLTFENLIVMDVNESVLPSLRVQEPLIPREIMIHLGLNRLEREEEIQRYHFSRLVAAARRVHLVYEENREKEPSRFVEQLFWERQKSEGSGRACPAVRSRFRLGLSKRPGIQVEKTPEVLDLLRDMVFSPTSIDTYVLCPLRFYYRYILSLQEREALEDEPESREIGDFIHRFLAEMLEPFLGKPYLPDAAFEDRFFRSFDSSFRKEFEQRMKADAFLLKGVLRRRLEVFLRQERQRGPRDIFALERAFAGDIEVDTFRVRLTARTDRIDRLPDGRLHILDYKTGTVSHLLPSRRLGDSSAAGRPLTRAGIRDTVRSFQLPLYLFLVRAAFPGERILAGYYSLRDCSLRDFPGPEGSLLTSRRGPDLLPVCMDRLAVVLREILDPGVPFAPATGADGDGDERDCGLCPFAEHCPGRY